MARSRCDYILNCSHERPTLARHGGRTLESRVLVSARKLRDLKAAPEGVEIEAIEPVERTARALQAVELSLPSSDVRER
jgi:hypothetical protein